MSEEQIMQKLVENFIRTANAFDIERTLSLFATDAVIDDVSVGSAFKGRDGVRLYLERFFVGYSTRTKLLAIEEEDSSHALVRVDFTGDFGHEIGILKIVVGQDGLITRIDADLE
jgi:ketosteroid isomerase-like protein